MIIIKPTYEQLENAFRDAVACVKSFGRDPSGEYGEIFKDVEAIEARLDGQGSE